MMKVRAQPQRVSRGVVMSLLPGPRGIANETSQLGPWAKDATRT